MLQHSPGMAQAAGVSREELGKMLETGIEVNDMIPLLSKGLENAFGSPKYIEGFDNALTRVKNSITILLTTDAGNSALAKGFDYISEAIIFLSKGVDTTQANLTNLFEVFAAFGKFDFSAPIESMKAVNDALNEATKNREADLKAINEQYQRLSVESMKEGQKSADASKRVFDETKKRELQLKALEDQYDKLGISSARSLKETADEMRSAFEKIKESGTETVETMDTAFLNLAEAELKAAVAAGKTVPPMLEQEAAARGLTKEFNDLVKTLVKVDESYQGFEKHSYQLGESRKELEKSAEVLRDWLKINEDIHRVQKVFIEDLQNRSGNWEKAIELGKQDLVILQDRFKISGDVLNSLVREGQMYDQLRQFINDYTAAVQKDNAIVQENINARIQQNKILEDEHRQRMQLAEQQGNLTEAAEEEAAAMNLAKDSAFSKFKQEQLNLESLKALELQTLNNALADGKLTDEESRQLEGIKNAINEQEKKTAKTKDETAATIAAIDASKQYNRVIDDFSDKVDDAARRNKTFTKEYEEFLKKVAEETKVQSQIASGFIQGWEQRLGSWSEKAKEAFQNVRSGTVSTGESMDKLSGAIERNSEEMATALRNMDTGWVKWSNTAATQALQVERSFLSQAQAAKQLTENLNEAANGAYGSTTQLVGLIQKAEQARGNLKLLDDSSLSALESSIDSARQKLEDLRQEAIDAKNELEKMNAELAAEKGDSLTADLLNNEVEYKEKLADIEAKLAQAQAENNLSLIAIYQQQKKILEDIYNQKEKNIRQDDDERKKQATSSSSSSSSSSSGTTTKSSGTSTSTNHVLQFKAPDGQTASASVNDEETAYRILEIIRKSGLRMAG